MRNYKSDPTVVESGSLPEFFVVGAQKAGTTSLHHWLSQQPAVCLPRNKETHFFSSDAQYAKGLAWYRRQFPNRGKSCIIGEVAPDYLFSHKAPERIHRLVPEARLIFIFREPLQRAYSHYLMMVRNGFETLSFYEALREEPERMRKGGDSRSRFSYLSRGLYSKQINEYKNYFADSCFMFVKFDDLVAEDGNNLDPLKSIASFIGLDQTALEAGPMEKNNPSSVPHSPMLRNILYRQSKFKSLLRFLLPSRDLRATIAHRLDLLNQRAVSKPEVGKVPRSVLQAAEMEIEALQSLTGLDLQDWLEGLSRYATD